MSSQMTCGVCESIEQPLDVVELSPYFYSSRKGEGPFIIIIIFFLYGKTFSFIKQNPQKEGKKKVNIKLLKKLNPRLYIFIH